MENNFLLTVIVEEKIRKSEDEKMSF